MQLQPQIGVLVVQIFLRGRAIPQEGNKAQRLVPENQPLRVLSNDTATKNTDCYSKITFALELTAN